MMRLVALGGGLLIILAWLLTQLNRAEAQEPDPQIKKIVGDWKKRQQAIKSLLIKAKGTKLIAQGAFNDPRGIKKTPTDYPPREITFKTSVDFLFDVAKGRYRIERDRQIYHLKTDKLYPEWAFSTFNGTFGSAYIPHEKNTYPTSGRKIGDPEFSIYTGHLGGVGFEAIYWPLFLGVGTVPTNRDSVSASSLHCRPDEELLRVHGLGFREGRQCVLLRTPALNSSFDEIWVDRGRDAAVVRLVLYGANLPYVQLDIDYQETKHGWFPSRWVFRAQKGTKAEEFKSSEEVVVEELVVNPDIAGVSFDIAIKPGQRVKEFVFPEPNFAAGQPPAKSSWKIFEIQSDGSRVLIESGGGLQKARSGPWLWLGASSLLPSGLGFWWLYRRRPKRVLG